MKQTDWEIVDDDSGRDRAGARPANLLRTLLGRWWKWKLAALAVAASALALVAGALVLLGLLAAVLFLAAVRVKAWLWPGTAGNRRRTGMTPWRPTTKRSME